MATAPASTSLAPAARTALRRSYSFRYKTLDVRSWYLDETVRRARAQILAAGGDAGGSVPLPKRRKLFTVLRSPHVNKKSREQFEMVHRYRLLKWTLEDTGTGDEGEVAHEIAARTEPGVAVRVTEERPAVLALAEYYLSPSGTEAASQQQQQQQRQRERAQEQVPGPGVE